MNAKPSRSTNWIPILALGALLAMCVCAVLAYAGLNALGVITTQVNLFPTGTPTLVAQQETGTPAASGTPTGAEPLRTLTFVTETPGATEAETPTPEIKETASTPSPTSDIPTSYVAFDADFSGTECPLFEGSNDTREYGCALGEYYMQHKQATTRYSFYDTEYSDAIVEADGYLNNGSGKYEYGVVFRANTDGTLYYVFTVTNDGKYNVALYQNEKYTDLIPYTASPLIHTDAGAANRFKVVMRGSKFDFYLNGGYLNSVTNTAIASGVTGFFFYNDQPNVEVGFDQLTVSTFTPPTPTSTPDAENPTPTATIPAVIAPTAAVKPGVYVNNLRLTPRGAKRGQPVTFYATFVNSTGKPQSFKWLVEIWEQDPNKKNPYGQADGQQREIATGTNELATGDSWKVAGGGPCTAFRARVVYEDDQTRRIPFKRTNGADLWVPFQVCP